MSPRLPTRRAEPADLIPSRRRLGPAAAQLAQDGGLAVLLGGNVFGRFAMHPALGDVSNETERGQVLNHAWRRYGNVNSLGLFAIVAGWLSTRGSASSPLWTSPERRSLILAKDIAVGAVTVTGLASAASGVGFSQQATDGAVPMADGNQPAEDTPPRARSLKHLVNLAGGLNLAAEVILLTVNVLLSRSAARRMPGR